MSDSIKHECGIALVRLLQPLDYYQKKYGSSFYGLNRMYLLMEKQHNRGQDGVGLACVKLDMQPGAPYMNRLRSVSTKPIQKIFDQVNKPFLNLEKKDPQKLADTAFLKKNYAFTGELLLGHLRYGTFGKSGKESCHPFLRENNWMTRNLAVAGNFNLTNVDELFDLLVNLGQHPKKMADTVTVMEKIGHFLDEENEQLFKKYKSLGYSNKDISSQIAKNLNIPGILKKSAEDWDGGYVMAGLIGHGDAFVLRDPNGIRPAFYYKDDEVVVVASERPAIQTTFNLHVDQVKEIDPGQCLVIKKEGEVSLHQVREPREKLSCSFERIYFSRGSDKDIYRERKELGRSVCPVVLNAIDHDLKNSVFSFIPNTAETSFYGLMKGMEDYMNVVKHKKIMEMGPNLDPEKLEAILSIRPRAEKLAIKDAKLRTFITQDEGRDDLVEHVYDITYGTIRNGVDNLVVIDDSIVRGTTLKKSILRILDRLQPNKIVVVSSAPQIRYPDCYGIDMAKLGDFIAFRATIELLKENGREKLIDDVYRLCKGQENSPKEEIVNHVTKIYEPFTPEEISLKISDLLKPPDIKAEVKIIYQTLEGLHKAIPGHSGDWYFSGRYPTPGGNKVVNRAFINFVEGRNERAY